MFVDGGEEPLWSVAEGNGPVNALDQALRKDLGRYQNIIKDVELVDYKVRILTGGTEAITRVLVESRDKGTGERWFTVGVSSNIVDASFEALINSITYKLLQGRCRRGLSAALEAPDRAATTILPIAMAGFAHADIAAEKCAHALLFARAVAHGAARHAEAVGAGDAGQVFILAIGGRVRLTVDDLVVAVAENAGVGRSAGNDSKTGDGKHHRHGVADLAHAHLPPRCGRGCDQSTTILWQERSARAGRAPAPSRWCRCWPR